MSDPLKMKDIQLLMSLQFQSLFTSQFFKSTKYQPDEMIPKKLLKHILCQFLKTSQVLVSFLAMLRMP